LRRAKWRVRMARVEILSPRTKNRGSEKLNEGNGSQKKKEEKVV
jgi:hypothetical protein